MTQHYYENSRYYQICDLWYIEKKKKYWELLLINYSRNKYENVCIKFSIFFSSAEIYAFISEIFCILENQ